MAMVLDGWSDLRVDFRIIGVQVPEGANPDGSTASRLQGVERGGIWRFPKSWGKAQQRWMVNCHPKPQGALLHIFVDGFLAKKPWDVMFFFHQHDTAGGPWSSQACFDHGSLQVGVPQLVIANDRGLATKKIWHIVDTC